MKKFVICLFAFTFVVAAAGMTFGRTMEEEKQAVRDDLNGVGAKRPTAKQANNKARIKLLHEEKAATLARWYKLKDEMENAVPVVPSPTSIIVNPTPVIIVNPTPEAGRGVGLYINGGLDAGLVGFSGNFDYDLSGIVTRGLSARIGVNYVYGTNPNGNDEVKAVSAKLGAVYYITPFLPDMGLPLTWYVGGAYLLPVKVNEGRTGRWGVEAYLGLNYNVPEMGIVNVEIGYTGLKYAVDQPALKGMDLKLGYGIIF